MIEAAPLRRFQWDVAPLLSTSELSALGPSSSLLVQLLHNRGVADHSAMLEFLAGADAPLYDPMLMADMPDAVRRIRRAIENRERTVVYGDYDADGITATTLLTEVLRYLGADVAPFIPLRADGYGLRGDALVDLARTGVTLAVTVDCGVGSSAEIAEAKEVGLDVVVTDHHAITGALPEAVAVVNPRRSDCAYPEKRLAGVGVAYKLAQALLRELVPDAADSISETKLDLVTIGTIADVVPLVGENRTLVSRGLPALTATSRPGLRALIQNSGKLQAPLSERDVSHRLAPRINATGRLTDAVISLDLLMDDGQRAEALALQLEALNAERQVLMEQSVARARLLLATIPERAFVAIRDDGCLPGVAGLVAARLTEQLVRPVAIVVPVGDLLRGSVRACTDFDVAQALAACSDLLLGHGGHKRAGGFSVRPDRFDEFVDRLSGLAEQSEQEAGVGRKLAIDAELGLRNLHWDNYQAIRRLAPFGHGNPEPVFLTRRLRVVRSRVVGRSEPAHLRLTLADVSRSIGGIAFRRGSDANRVPAVVDIAYQLTHDDYGAPTALEVRIVDFQASE